MFRNKLTLGYVLLVGVPLLFLVATLRAGGRLSAPPAVGGEWLIEAAPTTDSCLTPFTSVVQPAISVYQTGDDLLINWNDAQRTMFTGALQGRHLSGAAHGHGGAAIRLDAVITGGPRQKFLQGQLSVEGCGGTQFRASKTVMPGK